MDSSPSRGRVRYPSHSLPAGGSLRSPPASLRVIGITGAIALGLLVATGARAAVGPATVPGIDVVVQTVRTEPHPPAAGQSVPLVIQFFNLGDHAIDDFRVRVEVDLFNDGSVDGTFTREVGMVEARKSVPFKVSGRRGGGLIAFPLGTHAVRACAETPTVDEHRENNNCGKRVFQVVNKPDLAVGNLVVQGMRIGEDVAFSLRVSNRGKGTAPPTVLNVRLRSLREKLGGASSHFDVPELKPGASVTFSEKHWVTVLPPGEYRFEFCADLAHRADESNEKNNCVTRSYQVSVPRAPPGARPDFTVESIVVTRQNGTRQFNARIRNLGKVSSPRSLAHLQYYKGSDQSTPVYYEDTRVVPLLFPNGAVSLSWGPVPKHKFYHTVRVCADPEKRVTEANEKNNCLEKAVGEPKSFYAR